MKRTSFLQIAALGAVLALCAYAAQLPAQELPAPSVLVQAAPAAPETIATPAPVVAPLQVLESQTYAVPAARWGIFRLRVVPRTVYIQRHVLRPARVHGPLYLLR
jgi:anaerobic selenocysteine-containing dehydrogenase